MNDRRSRPKADRLRSLALPAVLEFCGAQPDRHDPAKWHTAQGVLSIRGAKFMNWNHGVGGGGAIDLVMHLHNCPFQEALDWLEHHFAGPPLATQESFAPVELKLPPPAPVHLGALRRYLLHQRALPSSLIEPLIQSRILYADVRANAVFLLLAEKNIPVGAELRGTYSSWRGMAPGSKKDLGFFSIPITSVRPIVLCESAIDAISCFVLHPNYRCISTAGARSNPRWLASLLTQGHQVYCGFDTDATGNAMAAAMMALHPAIRRLTPPQHDWNDTLRARP